LGAQAWPMRPFRGFRTVPTTVGRGTLRCVRLPVTLSGFTCLSELLSGPRSDALVRRSLLVVSTTSRSSALRPARTQASERLPQAWPPSQGTSLTADRRPRSPVPLLGFGAPSATSVTGSA
jgi:hypothetical protein